MGKARAVGMEFGLKGNLNGGKTYSVVGAEQTPLDSHDLFFAANIDAINFVALYHFGLVQSSTYCWLPAHAIEKFLKAYLLSKNGYSENRLKKISHNLTDLWKHYKLEFEFPSIPELEEYISELSEVKTSVRYGNTCVIYNDNLLSGFVFFVVHFNSYKNKRANYPATFYGFADHELPAYSVICGDKLKKLMYKYLHLVVEHSVTISPTGICHPHTYSVVDQLKQNRNVEDCPFCNGSAQLDLRQPGLTNKTACENVKKYFESNN